MEIKKLRWIEKLAPGWSPKDGPTGFFKTVWNQTSSGFRWGLLLSFIFSVHFAKVVHIMPPANLFNPQPIISNGYIAEYSEYQRAKEFQRETGSLWGYDPFMSAGKPAGIPMSPDRRITTFLLTTFDALIPPAFLHKAFLFVCLLLIPWVMFWSIRMMGEDIAVAAIGMILASAGFCNYDALSLGLFQFGKFNFIFANYLAVLAGALMVRVLEKGKIGRIFFLAPVFGLLLAWQSASFWILLPVYAFGIFMSSKKSGARGGLAFLGTMVLAALFNWPWLKAAFEWKNYFIPNPVFASEPSLWMGLLFGRGVGAASLLSLVRGILIIFCLGGVVIKFNEKKSLGFLWSGWLLWLGAIGTFGSHIPWVKQADPQQFLLSLSVLAIFPASKFLKEYVFVPRTARFIVSIILVWFLATYQFENPVLPLPSLRTGWLSAPGLIQDVMSKMPRQGNILWENVVYDNPEDPFLPLLTHQAFIGLPSKNMRSVFEEATAFSPKIERYSPHLFETDLANLDKERLLRLLDLHNVSTVVAFTLQGRHCFDRYPDVFRPVPVKKLFGAQFPKSYDDPKPWEWKEPYRVYNVRLAKPGYFLQGSGDLEIGYNRLVLQNPSQDNIILKFHWVDTLRSDPEGLIHPILVEGASLPFIAVQLKNRPDVKRVVIESR